MLGVTPLLEAARHDVRAAHGSIATT